LSEVVALANGGGLGCRTCLDASLDRDRCESPCWVTALSLLLDVLLDDAGLFAVGKGGKAQSRFVSSGEGGRRGPGNDPLRKLLNGDLEPDDALKGETMELCPLLAGVSSPG